MSLFPEPVEQPIIPEHIRVIEIMRRNNKRSLDVRKQTFKQNFQLFWENRWRTRAILQELWTEAWEWFEKSFEEQLNIQKKDPTWEILNAPYEYTKHDDNSVTLNEEDPE